jgi:hypothetical protein
MKVIEFKEFGGPSQLKLSERPLPQADANTAVVRIEAASVNPSDVKNVAGRMSQTTLPRVPGRDYSGVVVDGPKEWINREVWGTGGDVGFTRDGSHGEYIQVPIASLVRKPETLSHEQAACVGVTFVTAWCALNYAKLSKGETIAVFGANGGVGGAAVQIAKSLGAHVIGIHRGEPGGATPAAKLADILLGCHFQCCRGPGIRDRARPARASRPAGRNHLSHRTPRDVRSGGLLSQRVAAAWRGHSQAGPDCVRAHFGRAAVRLRFGHLSAAGHFKGHTSRPGAGGLRTGCQGRARACGPKAALS